MVKPQKNTADGQARAFCQCTGHASSLRGLGWTCRCHFGLCDSQLQVLAISSYILVPFLSKSR